MDEYVLARFLQEQMTARGWRQADLATQSGLSRQVISTLLKTPLRRMIEPATVAGLAKAFGLDEQAIKLKAAEAIGLPVGEVVTVVRSPTNRELVELLQARLGVTPSDEPATPNQPQDSGEPGTSGDVRDPRRQSRGSEPHERAAHPDAHPHLI